MGQCVAALTGVRKRESVPEPMADNAVEVEVKPGSIALTAGAVQDTDTDIADEVDAKKGSVVSPTGTTQDTDPMPVYIAVMGLTGSGKTTFVNLASGSSFNVGLGLESCTTEVQQSAPFAVDDKQVILVDMPGFGDTTLADSDIWRTIAASFVASHKEGKRFTGVIYMQSISDIRISGSARQSFKMFQDLCGEEMYPNVLLLTTMWDAVAPEVGDSRHHELATQDIFFKPVLDKGAEMMRYYNTRESATEVIRKFVDKPPATLRIQQELGGGVDITQTSVYRQLRDVLSDLVIQRQKDLDTLMEEMEEAERNGDEETRGELEEEVQTVKAQLQEAQGKVLRLTSEYERRSPGETPRSEE